MPTRLAPNVISRDKDRPIERMHWPCSVVRAFFLLARDSRLSPALRSWRKHRRYGLRAPAQARSTELFGTPHPQSLFCVTRATAAAAALHKAALLRATAARYPSLSVIVATVTCGQRTLLKIRITSWEYCNCKYVESLPVWLELPDRQAWLPRSFMQPNRRRPRIAHPLDPEGCACRVDEGVGGGIRRHSQGSRLVRWRGRDREGRGRRILSLVRDPQERDVADGLEQATDAERRDASRRLGVRREIDPDEAKNILVGDRIPQDGVGIVDKTLETLREWAGALVGQRRPRWQRRRQRPRRRRLIWHENVRVDVDLRNIMLGARRKGGGTGDGVEVYWLDPDGRRVRRPRRERERRVRTRVRPGEGHGTEPGYTLPGVLNGLRAGMTGLP